MAHSISPVLEQGGEGDTELVGTDPIISHLMSGEYSKETVVTKSNMENCIVCSEEQNAFLKHFDVYIKNNQIVNPDKSAIVAVNAPAGKLNIFYKDK